jgi:Protein of unknown function (DUF3383)
MTNTVNQSDFVAATLTIAPNAVPTQNFGLPALIGDSNIIDVNQRFQTFDSSLAVEQQFGSGAPEFLASEIIFGQSPQPAQIIIGRWARTATAGILHGASFTPAQQVISNFNTITNGAFFIQINGAPLAVVGLNFTAALNLNGVASVVQTALDALSNGVSVVFNSTLTRFDITSGTTGPSSSVSFGASPTAVGSATFSTQPANLDTLTLNGAAIEFVTGTPTGNEVQIGSTLAVTLQSLATFLNSSTNPDLTAASYLVVGDTLFITAIAPGAAGDSYTLVKTSTAITLSGATLAGGTGTDVSTLLGLTAASGASPPVIGIAPESLLAGVTALDSVSNAWYSLTVAASVTPMQSDYEAVAAFILSTGDKIFGVTINTPDILDPTNTSDLASNLQALNNQRLFVWYDPVSPFGAATIQGRIATINFNGSNTTITLAYKQAPGLTAAFLTETQFETLVDKGGNANVAVSNGAVMIYPGQMSNAKYFGGELVNGNWIDEIQNCDWFLNDVQTAVFNLLFQTTTKIPQTDAGNNIIAATITASCQQAVNNGMAAPGEWTGPSFGSLITGQTLATGFYIFYPPIATQSSADRASRKSVPFQIAIKLAGAIQTVDLIVTVNR